MSPLVSSRSVTRLWPVALLALLILSLAACASAFAAAGPRQADGCSPGADGCGEATGPQPPSVDNHVSAFRFGEALSKGMPFVCGQAANKQRGEADVACRVEATITVTPKIARFVGLSSRTIASGVASNVTDHLMDQDDNDLGRAYFLKFPASVRAKLKAKHVRALGIHVTGTITVPGAAKFFCGDSAQPVSSCALKAPKNVILAGEDGELLCWRFMPWGLATPATWGKMCPKPQHV